MNDPNLCCCTAALLCNHLSRLQCVNQTGKNSHFYWKLNQNGHQGLSIFNSELLLSLSCELNSSMNSVPFSALTAAHSESVLQPDFWPDDRMQGFETRKCRPSCPTVALTPNTSLARPPQVCSCWWPAASSPGSSSSSSRLRTNDTRTRAGNRCSWPLPPSTCGGRTCR